MQYRKLMAGILSGMLCLGLASCGQASGNASDVADNTSDGTASAEQVKVGILKWVTHDALDQSEQGFMDALKDGGYVEGENLTLDRQNANDDVSVANTIATKFVNNDSDLVLAIATPAVQSMQSKTDQIPILGTAVTDYEKASLVESNEDPGGNISGTTDMNPIEQQIDLLLEVLPDLKTLGIMYNSSEINAEIQSNIAKEYAESKGITVSVKTISSVNDIQQTATSLAKEVEAFWIPTDNKLASAMGVLASVAEEQKIPIVPGERGMVHAGASFTIGIDYYELGYETGKMAVEILKNGADISTMPIRRQSEFKVDINQEAVDKIGLTIPQSVLHRANAARDDATAN